MLWNKTWAGKSKGPVGNHHLGKACLDIHLLKAGLAAAHEAVPNTLLGLVQCANGIEPRGNIHTAHPILCWLPSNQVVWVQKTWAGTLHITNTWGCVEIDSGEQPVASGQNGRHLRTWGAIQWESEQYRGNCYSFNLQIWMVIVSRARALRYNIS